MERNTASILILTILIAISGGIAGWYFLAKNPYSPPVAGTPADEGSNSFFPPGSGTATVPPTSSENPSVVSSEEVPSIRQISAVPIAGFFIVEEKNKPPLVRYMEEASGHIYDAPLESLPLKRVSNTTIPRVRQAVFADSGNTVIARYLKEDGDVIESFKAQLKKAATSTSEGELQGTFLPENIEAIAVNPSGSSLFYIVKGESDASGFVSTVKIDKPTRIFSSPIHEWLPEWLTDSSILLYTKASSQAGGIVTILNTKSGETRTLSRGAGITAQGYGNTVIYGGSNGVISSFNTTSNASVVLPFGTLPEKCAVSADKTPVIFCGVPSILPSNIPDSWYQGLSNFRDNIWSIDPKSGEVKLAVDLEAAGRVLDVSSPKLTAGNSHLLFINKRDGTLWSVRMAD